MKRLIYTILFLLPLLIFGQYPVTDKQMVFQEQFTSEYDLIKNGGTSTDITYAYGQATYNGTTSKANYNLNLNGVYSVRIRCNPTSFTATRYLFDARGTNDDGVGRVRASSPNGVIVTTSGTVYVNGAATTSTTAGVNNEIVITGITLSQGTGANKTLIGSEKGGVSEFLGTIDLLEVYSGTLTPSQVENMFLGRTLIPFPQQVNEQSLQLLSKVESSQGVIYDVMGNTIVNTNVETIDIGQTEVQSYLGNGHLVLGNIGTINTLNFILYYDGTDQSGVIDLDGGTNTVEHSGGTLAYWGDDAYINGVNTNTLTYGWNYITIIDNTGQAASAYRIGYDGTDYYTGYLGTIEPYSGVFTLTQHTQFWTYNKQYLK